MLRKRPARKVRVQLEERAQPMVKWSQIPAEGGPTLGREPLPIIGRQDPHQLVDEEQVRRERLQREGLGGVLFLHGDAKPVVSLPEAQAVEEGDIGHGLRELHLTLRRARRALEMLLQPQEPGPAAHRPAHALFLGEQELPGPPRRHQRRSQGAARGDGVLARFRVQPVDLRGGRQDGGSINGAKPVVCRRAIQ